ncbi:hypothetical protein PY365_31610 [Roseiarcaceae bacterium H3SJ34-1]|uniref:hypothetical protein n=1 Tax=Terripilifer ovatus TaxID=3032367 RepID=UPI003AB951AD|nr:hypothetical protein [Roseiarcaceae bacterium H3SJ34-1]
MKLTSANVGQTLGHLDAKVVPYDHPVNEQLVSLFGNHTFFLDQSGLKIVEPEESREDGVVTGRVIKVAKWADGTRTSLAPHDREVTEIIVPLEQAA